MMPLPDEVAVLVDRAEQHVSGTPPLSTWPPLERRRMLAWAVFEQLRHDSDGARALEPVPLR